MPKAAPGSDARPIRAGGAVVVRRGEVLLVHRPTYDDWSFPKGKLDRGEAAPVAAVREVAEETGLTVRLGRPLADQQYGVGSREKQVCYWLARVTGGDDVSGYRPNREIDAVTWLPWADARRRLTYDRDRETLLEAEEESRRTRTLVVLRHARARSRRRWRADDRFRTLLQDGVRQAERLRPVLAAYGVSRLVSSSSTRCVSTLVPYADTAGHRIETEDGLSEEAARPDEVARIVEGLLALKEPVVVCSHRPVLPDLFAGLGLPDPGLEVAEMLVVHHRKGRVLATERHHVP